jgi:hypothetical protein
MIKDSRLKRVLILIAPYYFCFFIMCDVFMLLNIEKASAAKGGSGGSPPGKIKNLRKGVL